MSKIEELKRYVEPPPRLCLACKTYKPDCLVPMDDGEARMCWLCAHHHVEHEKPLHECATAQCECSPVDVYPADVLAKRLAPASASATVVAVGKDADRRKAS